MPNLAVYCAAVIAVKESRNRKIKWPNNAMHYIEDSAVCEQA